MSIDDYENRHGSLCNYCCRRSTGGSKAEEELAELNRQAKEKAKGNARALVGELENQKAVLRSRAESRLEQAASLVVERIVNS